MPTFTATSKHLLVLTLCTLAMAAHADSCGEKLGASSFESSRCRGALLDAQETQLETYLKAAESQVKVHAQGSEKPAIDLRKAQQAWEAYRTAQCGDVYLFWVDGSYRYEAAFACNRQLIRERMHDLWSSYLNVPAGGPPALPEP